MADGRAATSVRETVASVYRTAGDREITFLAAGFACYAFVSLGPLGCSRWSSPSGAA